MTWARLVCSTSAHLSVAEIERVFFMDLDQFSSRRVDLLREACRVLTRVDLLDVPRPAAGRACHVVVVLPTPAGLRFPATERPLVRTPLRHLPASGHVNGCGGRSETSARPRGASGGRPVGNPWYFWHRALHLAPAA